MWILAQPSANTQWGNSKCVLAGDWLYMQAFKVAVAERNFAVLDTLIELTQKMVEGELLQMEKELLGIYVSSHPLTERQSDVEAFGQNTTKQMQHLSDGTPVKLAAMISAVRARVGKTGRSAGKKSGLGSSNSTGSRITHATRSSINPSSACGSLCGKVAVRSRVALGTPARRAVVPTYQSCQP